MFKSRSYFVSKTIVLLGILMTSMLYVLTVAPFAVLAASAEISIGVPTGVYGVGDTMALEVLVDTDALVNAASVELSYDASVLEVVSTSKDASLLSFYVDEPVYSNSDGTLVFSGAALGSGFIGSNGNLLSFSVRIKQEGTTQITFETASVLANDGEGTNILGSIENAIFTFGADEEVVSTTRTPEASEREYIYGDTNEVQVVEGGDISVVEDDGMVADGSRADRLQRYVWFLLLALIVVFLALLWFFIFGSKCRCGCEDCKNCEHKRRRQPSTESAPVESSVSQIDNTSTTNMAEPDIVLPSSYTNKKE